MAQKVDIRIVDDLDGSDAAGTVSFALDGRSYEIDLSDDNAARLRDSLATFIAAARKSGSASARRRAGRGATTGTGAAAVAGQDTAAIRTWARENGHEVSERGRIARAVVQAYVAAH